MTDTAIGASGQMRRICMKIRPVKFAIAALSRAWGKRNHPHVRHLNAHLAQDAGLTPAELAQHQHQYPSQCRQHPRL